MRLLLGTTVALCALAMPAATQAAGGTYIRDAPTISFGTQYFGSTADKPYNGGCCWVEWWKVPLIVGDKFTLNIERASTDNGPSAVELYPPGTDDYNLRNTQRVASADAESKFGQLRYSAQRTGLFVMDVFTSEDYDRPGGYDFTAYVKHLIRMTPPSGTTVPRKGVWSVAVRYGDGSPVTDPALSLELRATWGRRSHVIGRAGPSHGLARIGFALPASLRGKRLTLVARASGGANQPATIRRIVRVR